LYTDPTATQLLAEVHETEEKDACWTPAGLGVGAIAQLTAAVAVPARPVSRASVRGRIARRRVKGVPLRSQVSRMDVAEARPHILAWGSQDDYRVS